MSRYRVAEGAPGVSLNKQVYLPGELLPEDLSAEAVEQLTKNGAIEKASAKDISSTELKTVEETEEQKAKAAALADADAKAAAEAKAKTEAAKTSGQQKPPAK